MNCRRHGSKPTIALWMLVAAADVAIIMASTGLLVALLLLTALTVIIGGGVYAARSIGVREPQPAKAVVRRRA
ncbi:hypothetical protein Ait01nite_008010 [Actinoplanes italicus]|jgi:hypothetical protein|uniref:Uncharacterized protein n=1 Tax=Actinoplanes italicus TaxID=113567 RepID=A0A2T0KM07_9ACTN|nr:hypothetical protein [Actinoplanes italicus]PRX24517.1 hypothetical protein CLV67_102294 [Actinoplanes italicus]GIE27756.1 hypothetical protein Ait01nite_008010 [Actinoplanes italicus]